MPHVILYFTGTAGGSQGMGYQTVNPPAAQDCGTPLGSPTDQVVFRCPKKGEKIGKIA